MFHIFNTVIDDIILRDYFIFVTGDKLWRMLIFVKIRLILKAEIVSGRKLQKLGDIFQIFGGKSCVQLHSFFGRKRNALKEKIIAGSFFLPATFSSRNNFCLFKVILNFKSKKTLRHYANTIS